MRVLYFMYEFPLVTENFIIYEIDSLIRRGVDINILSLTRPPAGKRSVLPEEMGFSDRITYRPALKTSRLARGLRTLWLLLKLIGRGNITAVKRLFSDRSAAGEYSRYILLETAEALHKADPNPDVICSHFGPAGRFLAILKHYNLITAPFTTTFHGYDVTRYIQNNPKDIYDRLYQHASGLICVSQYFLNSIIKLGAAPEKGRVLHTAVNCTDFEFVPRALPETGPVRFICVGRLTEKKGHEYLVEAFAKLCQSNPDRDFHLDLIGGGPLEEAVSAQIKAANMTENVTLHGAIQHKEVKRLLSDSHIFVLHSVVASDGDTEGIPCSLMEAMAQGLPVISTIHTGIPELIDHGVTGLLGPERDAARLYELMQHMIDHPETWPDMTQTARQKVEQEFEREKEADKLAVFFEEIVG